jgi:hypothetical protein
MGHGVCHDRGSGANTMSDGVRLNIVEIHATTGILDQSTAIQVFYS